MYELEVAVRRNSAQSRVRAKEDDGAVKKRTRARQASSAVADPSRVDLLHPAQERSHVMHEASGRHLLLTLRECSPELLNDEAKLRQLTLAAAQATGATVLEVCSHKFAPQGVTALAVLAESHASLHTYPEANLVFWDCFTCGSTCNPELSVSILVEKLKAAVVSKQVISRS